MRQTLLEHRLTLIYLVATVLVMALLTALATGLAITPIILLGVISPLLLAMAFSYYEGHWSGVKELFVHPHGFHFNALATGCALLMPLALMMLSIAISSGSWAMPDFDAMLAKLPFLMVLMAGEEFGWRRYAFARLSKSLSFMVSANIVGIAWLTWHYPGYLVGMGTPEELSFWFFGLMVLPASILMAFLYRWTRNVYLVILAHVSSNLGFIGLPLLPEITGNTSAFVVYTGLLWLMVLPLLMNKKYW